MKALQVIKLSNFIFIFHSVLLGGANLHVNVSVEITGETFHSGLTSKGSATFENKTSWLEAQVSTGERSCFSYNVNRRIFSQNLI